MKTLRLLAIGFAISATAAACSPSQHQLSILEDSLSGNEASKGLDIRMIEKSYLACLGSGNPGEVESALDHVIYMRIAFPDEDLRENEAPRRKQRGICDALKECELVCLVYYFIFTFKPLFSDIF